MFLKTIFSSLFLVFMTCFVAFGQTPEQSYQPFQSTRNGGIKAGVNVATIPQMAESDLFLGFHAGIFGNAQVSRHVGYGGEMNYSRQGVTIQNVECALNYFNIPVVVNVHTGPVTFQGGLYWAMLLGAKAGDDKDITSYLQATDYGLLVGLNFNTSGPTFFSARYNLGLQNINDGFAIPKEADIRNRNIQFGAGYKF